MGKIRSVTLGDEENEKEQKRKADARRATKQSKKAKSEDEEKASDAPAVETTTEAATVDKKSEKGSRGPKVHGKKYVEMRSKVDFKKLYPVASGVELVKETSFSKFDGTVELHLVLFEHALSDNKDYRGSVTLPHGTGKTIKVAIADEALIAKVESGTIDFDILVASPSIMPKLAKVARVLGPKGLMPNPKNGTVSPDPEKRAKELAGGSVNFKTEPENPIIHLSVGKVSFDTKKLVDNIQTVLQTIGRTKISRATISATMSPGVKLAIV